MQKIARPIRTGEDYINSLRGRNLKIYLFGELVKDYVEHPMIRPSINAVAETYDLAVREEELASAQSSISGTRVNRFLHIAESAEDLVLQNKMQRKMGQNTGTCFQRCVGMDALNSLHSTTFEIDEKHGTKYHQRLLNFIKEMQAENYVIGGAMTDPKGDRSLGPAEQEDPDMFVHIVEENDKGVFITGAKAHQTGCINSHWILVMPTLRLTENDKDYAIVGAVPADAEGITYIYGRQSCDTRLLENPEGGNLDAGSRYGGQECMVVFDDVFVPSERIFMDGEWDFTNRLVETFAAYHRCSYACKTGVGDVAIGAAALIAEYNGVAKASHIRDKIVEMIHLNETIWSGCVACSYKATKSPAGNYLVDLLLANVTKQNVTRFPFEIARLLQDIAGGLMVTMPGAAEFDNPETKKYIELYLKGAGDGSAVNRFKLLRLIENLTLGRAAVGYLTESMHGAGSPQAQRIMISRYADIGRKKTMAGKIAGIGM